jgi:hypothetical protein
MTLPTLIIVSLLALFALPLVSQMSGNPNSPSASVRTQKQANKTTADKAASSRDDVSA